MVAVVQWMRGEMMYMQSHRTQREAIQYYSKVNLGENTTR